MDPKKKLFALWRLLNLSVCIFPSNWEFSVRLFLTERPQRSWNLLSFFPSIFIFNLQFIEDLFIHDEKSSFCLIESVAKVVHIFYIH